MGKYYKSKKYQLRISLKDKPGLKQQELTDEGKEGLPERLDSSEHLHRKSGGGGGGGGGGDSMSEKGIRIDMNLIYTL